MQRSVDQQGPLPADQADHLLVPAYVGRQPIFDRRLRVHAYELLFRSSLENRADVDDGNRATACILVNSFMELGLESVVGDRKAFINVTRDFLLGESFDLLPPDRVCLEILEDIPADEEVIERCRHLVERGYTLVLDDFAFAEDKLPFLELADIIKVDIFGLGEDGIREQVDKLSGYHGQLLAEKVETREEFELCRELGFHWFQGFFLQKPDIVQGRSMAADRLAMLDLLSRVNSPTVTIEELESIISRDVTLSYLLLRYINSARYALRGQIESIQHALMMLGAESVKSWATLIALARLSGAPSELLITSMVRGRMCEQIARRLGQSHGQSSFTAGLLSLLDALVGRPMAEILEQLHLSDELTGALVHREGELGGLLSCVVDYEHGEVDGPGVAGLGMEDVRDEFLEAIKWVYEVRSAISEPE